MNSIFVKKVDSTNSYLKELIKVQELQDLTVVQSDFQTKGRGQSDNHWESENAKNLLFSIYLKPKQLPAAQQFFISQIVSLAVCRVLQAHVKNVKIKWPNDIYVGDNKIAGILIENSWKGAYVEYSVVGVGLNINQTTFLSNAPNPISLKQIKHKSFNRRQILKDIMFQVLCLYTCKISDVKDIYFQNLYRNDDFFKYKDEEGEFTAKIVDVKEDGQIELETSSGHQKLYYFKEVEYIL